MRLLLALAGVAVASAADGFVHYTGGCRDSTGTNAVVDETPNSLAYHDVPSLGTCFDVCLNHTSSSCGAVMWYHITSPAYNAVALSLIHI